MTITTIDTEFKPTDFSEFHGQREMKARLDVACQSAVARKARLDHVLLTGPPGSGKSTIATLLAERMNEPLITIPQGVTPRQLIGYLYDGELGCVTLIDEGHCLPSALQNRLLELLEGGSFDGVAFPFSCVVLATTQPEKLIQPLIDRFPIRPRFAPYTETEMAKIVAGFADKAGVTLTKAACRRLGVAAAGVPRTARSLVIAGRDLALCGRQPTVDAILNFCGRSADGLSLEHLDYLRALDANRGQAGLETLSARLRMHKATIQELERLLVERKLLVMESSGRLLTGAGRRRLQEAA